MLKRPQTANFYENNNNQAHYFVIKYCENHQPVKQGYIYTSLSLPLSLNSYITFHSHASCFHIHFLLPIFFKCFILNPVFFGSHRNFLQRKGCGEVPPFFDDVLHYLPPYVFSRSFSTTIKHPRCA